MATQPTQETAWEEEEECTPEDDSVVWGRAVSTNAKFTNVEMIDNSVVFGRKSTCEVVLSDPQISGRHMRIYREESSDPAMSSNVWVEDLSSNGTFINTTKIGKGKRALVSHATEIVLIPAGRKRDKVSYILYIQDNASQQSKGGVVADKYDIREELGNGAFARVNLAIERSTGDKYAMKIVDKKKFALTGTKREGALFDECKILKQVSHSNIISIKEMIDTPDQLYIALELVYGGELFDRIVGMGKFSEEQSRDVLQQLLSAITYLHDHNIIHRDLKPENILLTRKDSFEIKLSDFGLSRMFSPDSFAKTICGTPQYLAPELLTRELQDPRGYSKEVDFWSMGVILYVMLSGIPPFHDNKPRTILEQVKLGDYDFPRDQWRGVSKTAVDLVKRLLTVDPKKRITGHEIAIHPWMLGYAATPKPGELQKSIDEHQRRTHKRPSSDTASNTSMGEAGQNDDEQSGDGRASKRRKVTPKTGITAVMQQQCNVSGNGS